MYEEVSMVFDPELERSPLTDDERRLLSDSARCGEQGAPSLAARLVTDVAVSAIDWSSSWAQALIERATFVGCRFRGLDLSGAKCREVTFERCKFEGCRYDGAVFEACRFIACELTESRLEGTSLHDCRFVESELSELMLDGVRLDGVHTARGRLAHVRLSECMVHFWELVGTSVESVRLTLCEVGRMALTGCETTQLAILGGSYGSFELTGGTLNDLGFASAQLATLQLGELTDATRLRVNESHVRALSLEGNTISDLYLWRSELQRLSVSGGSYEGWITECTVGSGSRIADAELSAFFWDGTSAVDLTFSRVQLRRFLCARGARFTGMKLEGLRYSEGFELQLEDTRFEHCDPFPPPRGDGGTR